jgi:hypothetical protein
MELHNELYEKTIKYKKMENELNNMKNELNKLTEKIKTSETSKTIFDVFYENFNKNALDDIIIKTMDTILKNNDNNYIKKNMILFMCNRWNEQITTLMFSICNNYDIRTIGYDICNGYTPHGYICRYCTNDVVIDMVFDDLI